MSVQIRLAFLTCLLSLCSLISPWAYSQDESSLLVEEETEKVASEASERAKELAARVIELTDSGLTAEKITSRLIRLEAAQLRNATGLSDDEKRQRLRASQLAYEEVYSEVAPDEMLRQQVVKTYTDRFSEEELAELLGFFESPLGVKFREDAPAMKKEIEGIYQNVVQANAPKVAEAFLENLTQLELESLEEDEPGKN